MALRSVTIKSAGGDYSSASAMFAGEVGNLTAAGLNRQLEVACSAIVGDGFAAAGAGWTTDATHTVLMYAVDNHNGSFGGAGGTSAYSGFVSYDIDFATLRGISSLGPRSANTSTVFDRCIGQASGISGTGFDLGTNGIAVDCVAIGTPGNAQNGFAATGTSTLTTCSNCTTYGCDRGFTSLSGTMVAKNCAAVACSTFGFSASTVWTGSSNCASTDATVPTSGTGHRASQTITLIDPTNGDYRLSALDTGCQGFGTNLSADATFPFSIDFTGAPRPTQWDIGASNAYSIPHSGRFQRRAAFGLMGVM